MGEATVSSAKPHEVQQVLVNISKAKGIVYFNTNGFPVKVLKSNLMFETWVEVDDTSLVSGITRQYEGVLYEKALMPKIINNDREAIGRQVVLYQQYDHEIAALTLIFNRLIKHDTKLLSNNKIYHLAETEEIKLPFPHRGQGRFLVGNPSYTVLPSPLDPTLVKAVCMQESRCGFDQDAGTDIMQVNVLGDWVEEKSSLGLVYNKVPSPWLSLKAGIAWLISKGFEAHEYYMKGLEWKDKKWDYRKAEINNIRNTLEPNCALFLIYTWNSDWWKAVQKYNGGGTKNYSESVKSYYHNTRESVQSDYYVDDTLYIVPDILG